MSASVMLMRPYSSPSILNEVQSHVSSLMAPVKQLRGTRDFVLEKILDDAEKTLRIQKKNGQTFEDIGKRFISNLEVANWRSLASFETVNAYNKVLIRDMGVGSLFIISWRAGLGSPIHTHHADGCVFKVIEGQPSSAVLTETRWDVDGMESGTYYAGPGELGWVHNSMGSHKVMNHTKDWICSLHFYPNADNNTSNLKVA